MLPSALSGRNPQNFPLKNCLYFFLKKPALKKFLIFSYIYIFFSNFQETELSYIFLRKVFPIFREMHIQNPGIFKTRSIFGTLVYSEPETYSEHCQISTMERFAKIATQLTFRFQPSKFFQKRPALKNFLIFRETELSLIFQEVTFRARKENVSYI